MFLKKLLLSLIIILVQSTLAIVDTVKTDILADITWSSDTVFITKNIRVGSGVTLTVTPGVTVKIQSEKRIEVDGNIIALGTEADSIIFYSDYSWNGIRFNFDRESSLELPLSKFEYCRFTSAHYNSLDGEYGSTLYLGYNSDVNMKHCLIDSSSGSRGGAVFCDSSSRLLIENSVFRDNIDEFYGGGAIFTANDVPVSLTVTNSGFYNNKGAYGGALLIGNRTSAIVDNCVFKGNYATNTLPTGFNNVNYKQPGGGALAILSDSVVVRNSLIVENGSYLNGGGLYISGASPRLINLTMTANYAQMGAAVFITSGENEDVKPHILNTAIANNDNKPIGPEDSLGRSIYFDSSTTALIKNTAIGSDAVLVQAEGGEVTGDFQDLIMNMPGSTFFCGDHRNPIDDTLGVYIPFVIAAWCPLDNAGIEDTSGLGLPVNDLLGHTRVSDGRVDIGALESDIDGYTVEILPEINQLASPKFGGEQKVVIFSLQGKILGDFTVDGTMHEILSEITERFSTGLYICKIQNIGGGAVWTGKISLKR